MGLLIYKRPFSRSYENEFFREFATALSSLFHRKGWNGLLFGSPEIERDATLQIDALLISERHVCLIDFKNYGGTIRLPGNQQAFENLAWFTAAGEMVRGGNSINPFVQLKKQNTKLINVIEKDVLPLLEPGDSIHTFQLKRIICFQKAIQFEGQVPAKREMTFFLADIHTILGKIEDILDVEGSETRISIASLRKISQIFKAPEFIDNSSIIEQRAANEAKEISLKAIEVAEADEEPFTPTPDQQEILRHFAAFLQNAEQHIFIIQGSSQSGKTRMIPMLRDVAFQHTIRDVELLAPSSRIAIAAERESRHEVHSLYSYLFERKKKSLKEPQEDEQATEEESEPEEINQLSYIYPLKRNQGDDKALFIIEEAQQLGDKFVQIEDFAFGSGHLLHDFLQYAQLRESGRKCVMLGDPYLVNNLGQERAIAPAYLKEAYGLGVEAYMLSPNKPSKPADSILGQTFRLINAIDDGIFNHLKVETSREVEKPAREEVDLLLQNELNQNFWDFKFLTYSHKQALEVNLWIKQDLIGNGRNLHEGDLLLFHRGVMNRDEDPLVSDYYIRNGDIMQVSGLKDVYLTPAVKLKGRQQSVSLHMQEVKLKHKDNGREVSIHIILEYLERESPDLYKDEILVLKILFDRLVKEAIRNKPFEQSDFYSKSIEGKEKPIDEKQLKKLKREYRKHVEEELRPSSPYTNYGLVRYGWSMNVHKAVPSKFRHIMLNCDYKHDNRGTDNEAYFSWLYSGFTRATEKLYLLGMQPFNCLKKVELKQGEPLSEFSIPKKQLSLDLLSPAKEEELAFALKYQMDAEKIALIRYAMVLNASLERKGIRLHAIKQHLYHEIYTLEKASQQIGKLKVFYNAKWQFKPAVPEKVSKEHEELLLQALQEDGGTDLFTDLSPAWRKDIYQQLSQESEKKGLQLKCIDPKSEYLDRVYFQKEEEVLVVDMHYNKEGFFSSLISKIPAETSSWGLFQECIHSLKTIHP